MHEPFSILTADEGTAACVDVDLFAPNPWQYRAITEEAIEDLARSIETQGQLEPILFRRAPADQGRPLQIICGERRWRAILRLRERASTAEERARWSTILALEKTGVADEKLLEWAITENLHRADASDLETGSALALLQKERDLTGEELARMFSRSVDQTRRLLRLANAPEVIREPVRRGQLDTYSALALLSLYGELHLRHPTTFAAEFENVLRVVLDEGWSYRKINELVNRRRAALGAPTRTASGAGRSAPRKTPFRLFRSTPQRLVVELEQLHSARDDERRELTQVLMNLLNELAR